MSEDIEQEVMAMEAIYGSAFYIVEREPEHIWRIELTPGNEEANEKHKIWVSLTLEVRLKSGYPNYPPQCFIQDSVGLTEDDVTAILKKINTSAQESLGTPMIFNLAEVCKEWLNENNVDPEQKLRQEEIRIEEQKKKRRMMGTHVTRETFLKWLEEREMKLRKQKELVSPNTITTQKTRKMTGKEMFEANNSLVTSDAQFESEGTAADIDWSLFQKLGKEEEGTFDDLEDEDFENEEQEE